MRGLEKLLNRERMNLDLCKDRLDRIKTNAGEPVKSESPNYAGKIAKEAISLHDSPHSSKERSAQQQVELASY